MCSCESDANCPDGQKCDLETKQCVAEDCASVLLATRPDVEVATDAASFTAAQRPNKDIIAIVNDIPAISDYGYVVFSKKHIVGPNYFTDIPACKTTERPTVFNSIGLSDGSIEEISIARTTGPANSIIKNVSVTGSLSARNVTFQGNVSVETPSRKKSPTEAASILQTDEGIDIQGKLTLTAYAYTGLMTGDASDDPVYDVKISSGGALNIEMGKA